MLSDGSRHRVFKRYLGADELAAELHGEVLLRGTWFVAVRAALARRRPSGLRGGALRGRRRRRPRPSGCSATSAATTAGSNCVPALRSSSSIAGGSGSALR